jgi:hypothetical protein
VATLPVAWQPPPPPSSFTFAAGFSAFFAARCVAAGCCSWLLQLAVAAGCTC